MPDLHDLCLCDALTLQLMIVRSRVEDYGR